MASHHALLLRLLGRSARCGRLTGCRGPLRATRLGDRRATARHVDVAPLEHRAGFASRGLVTVDEGGEVAEQTLGLPGLGKLALGEQDLAPAIAGGLRLLISLAREVIDEREPEGLEERSHPIEARRFGALPHELASRRGKGDRPCPRLIHRSRDGEPASRDGRVWAVDPRRGQGRQTTEAIGETGEGEELRTPCHIHHHEKAPVRDLKDEPPAVPPVGGTSVAPSGREGGDATVPERAWERQFVVNRGETPEGHPPLDGDLDHAIVAIQPETEPPGLALPPDLDRPEEDEDRAQVHCEDQW